MKRVRRKIAPPAGRGVISAAAVVVEVAAVANGAIAVTNFA